MSLETNHYNVVVAGAMNPPIHHPIWYGKVGLIDDDAEAYALTKSVICTDDASRFETARFILNCGKDNWNVQTSDEQNFNACLAIAYAVFDEKLPETPVTGCGLNYIYHRCVRGKDVPQILGGIAPIVPIGVAPLAPDAALYRFRLTREKHVLTIRVEPSVKGNDLVYIAFNYHYQAPGDGKDVKQFSVKELVDSGAQENLVEAVSLRNSIVARLLEA